MQEMDELYKDRPTQTNTYEVEGVRHTVISHFIGDRDINDVMFDYAYNRVLYEITNGISCHKTA